jgi:hypothetical protein
MAKVIFFTLITKFCALQVKIRGIGCFFVFKPMSGLKGWGCGYDFTAVSILHGTSDKALMTGV